ncbi:PB1 domain, AUX/IAA protein [Artemisia annua]|uniref:Auxin-responsive protein n=1 Tax=Artemisia annua TaxID=35608 RepID=A0A2U1NJD6_ARTAN|nr:PB1 domain, AUX/IAA protein [Artemisia annua]
MTMNLFIIRRSENMVMMMINMFLKRCLFLFGIAFVMQTSLVKKTMMVIMKLSRIRSSFIKGVCHRNDGGVIGWPPVKLCRRKSLCHSKLSNKDGDNGSKSMYVKVHMEGIGIARKVDVSLHNSYQTFVHTLANMFGKCYEDVILTYQDKEGDWLLAGDVPWGSFVKTVQRLKLLRN